LTNATPRVEVTLRVLGRKPLIEMIVSRDDEVHIGRVEYVPELLHLVLAAVHPRAVARMMEVRDGASLPMRREIGGEPLALGHVARTGAAFCRRCRRRLARRPLRRAVQHDHMPCAEIVAVIAQGWRRRDAEVSEVA